MRIAIGQVWQETNTFNPIPTTRADFESFGVLRGDELLTHLADTNEPGGFIQSLRAWPESPEIVGLVRLPAWPSGTATADTYQWMRSEMRSALAHAGKVDAVLLALHGAMVADGNPDVEGAMLDVVRSHVGASVPIVATLDLHANITEQMVRLADALVLYHTTPHIDVFETGVRGAAVLRRILIDGIRPVRGFVKIPLVVPAENANTQDPKSVSFGIREHLVELEKHPDILAAGLATVQPWLDIPELGSAAVVIATSSEVARSTCADLATRFWSQRQGYFGELIEVRDAVDRAHAICGEGLVVIADPADATTSGAPGDSTALLAALLRHEWPRPVLVTLVDPDLVGELSAVEVGTLWRGKVGRKRDTRFGRSIALEATVERHFEARFTITGHLARNLPIDMGRCVVLRCGEVRVIVTQRTGPHFAPELFLAAGYDPFSAAVLIAKSPCGFRAAYQPHAREIIVACGAGCAPPDFWHYHYENIPHPTWPFDSVETDSIVPCVFE